MGICRAGCWKCPSTAGAERAAGRSRAVPSHEARSNALPSNPAGSAKRDGRREKRETSSSRLCLLVVSEPSRQAGEVLEQRRAAQSRIRAANCTAKQTAPGHRGLCCHRVFVSGKGFLFIERSFVLLRATKLPLPTFCWRRVTEGELWLGGKELKELCSAPRLRCSCGNSSGFCG